MKLSKDELMNCFSAYQSEATYTAGNKSTHQMISIDDAKQTLEEIMDDDDVIHLVSSKTHLKSLINELESALNEKNIELKEMKKQYSKM